MSLSGSNSLEAQLNALDEAEEYADAELVKVWSELAKTNYHDFYEYMNRNEELPDGPDGEIRKGYVMSPHQRLIGDLLMAAECKETMRFMLSMPPGHCKSTHSSHHFPAWYFGRNPRHKFLQAGHSQDFVANELGATVRAIIDSDEYRTVFPAIGLRADMRAKDYWGLNNRKGKYVGKGVGQGISGFRGNFGMVDDPFKSRAAAESPTIRDATFKWYADDFSTRLLPGSPLGIIMTRWHSDDICGRITDRTDREKAEKAEQEETFKKLQSNILDQATEIDGKKATYTFEVINLPALADDDDVLGRAPGEPLWPELFDRDALNNLRADMTAASWNSLYQGTPMDIEGGAVQSEWFKRYDKLPDRGDKEHASSIRRCVLSVDAANTKKERSDYSVITVWIEDKHRNHYLADVFRKQVEFNELCSEIDLMTDRWARIAGEVNAILVEAKGNGLAYLQLKENGGAKAPLIPIEVGNSSKEFRFDKVTPMFEAGQVHLPNRALWLAEYEKELIGFPHAKHDDQVDSTGQYLDWSRQKTRRGTKKATGSGYEGQ